MESKSNLVKAVLSVMKEVKGIEKSMTVGTGANQYKGVADKDVKKIIGEAMEKNGLCLLPIGVKPVEKVERWEQDYNGQKQMKQSVFTSVTTEYLLIHESGESQVICGYGHGVDSQDKGAGKATTYALKYALLYTFLVPTGKIDDADNIHSDEQPIPPKKVAKPELKKDSEAFTKAIDFLSKEGTLQQIEAKYLLTAEVRALLLDASAQNLG